ncbi:hypothetical protein B0H16DRAFT_1458404 [Mycena metata]|uniref:Uncharacterized protein n=1 Tax=Mycena metata TaxID=1033252 RepID=A0AAD7J582_9AGAR|nr:hypothetical protein B0H16DRAFT_1458404 [Mycena metata]
MPQDGLAARRPPRSYPERRGSEIVGAEKPIAAAGSARQWGSSCARRGVHPPASRQVQIRIDGSSGQLSTSDQNLSSDSRKTEGKPVADVFMSRNVDAEFPIHPQTVFIAARPLSGRENFLFQFDLQPKAFLFSPARSSSTAFNIAPFLIPTLNFFDPENSRLPATLYSGNIGVSIQIHVAVEYMARADINDPVPPVTAPLTTLRSLTAVRVRRSSDLASPIAIIQPPGNGHRRIVATHQVMISTGSHVKYVLKVEYGEPHRDLHSGSGLARLLINDLARRAGLLKAQPAPNTLSAWGGLHILGFNYPPLFQRPGRRKQVRVGEGRGPRLRDANDALNGREGRRQSVRRYDLELWKSFEARRDVVSAAITEPRGLGMVDKWKT